MRVLFVGFLSVLAICGVSRAIAQTANFTQQATDLIRVCAPSENLRLKLEGSVGGIIAKKLAGAEAAGEGDVFRDGELLGLLVQASPKDAPLIYQMYLNCVQPNIDKILGSIFSFYDPGYPEPTEAEMRLALEMAMEERGASRKDGGFVVENPLNGMKISIYSFQKDSCRVAGSGSGYDCTFIVETGLSAFSNESSDAGQDHANAVNQLLQLFAGGRTSAREVGRKRFFKHDGAWISIDI
ncbi:MAG: hypothetical protein ABJO09_20500 [Hyphomicrobiales bacterium]